jgi:hypothetical protein
MNHLTDDAIDNLRLCAWDRCTAAYDALIEAQRHSQQTGDYSRVTPALDAWDRARTSWALWLFVGDQRRAALSPESRADIAAALAGARQ